jgi:hypothetical protein
VSAEMLICKGKMVRSRTGVHSDALWNHLLGAAYLHGHDHGHEAGYHT